MVLESSLRQTFNGKLRFPLVSHLPEVGTTAFESFLERTPLTTTATEFATGWAFRFRIQEDTGNLNGNISLEDGANVLASATVPLVQNSEYNIVYKDDGSTLSAYLNGSNTPFLTARTESVYSNRIGAFNREGAGNNSFISAGSISSISSLRISYPHPPGPRGAAATAQVVNGFVVGATLLDGGLGYTNAPSVVITGGGGSGASAQSVISNGVVVGIEVISAGSGYTATPSILIDLPPIPPRRATATAVLSEGGVGSISIQDGGAGYHAAAPAVRITGGGGSGATATAIVTNGTVTGFVITNPGAGYTGVPRVSIASPPFSPELDLQVSRVALNMKVVLGSRYQIESSDGLGEWNAVGDPFVAEDELLVQEFEVGATRRFFRIRQVP
jgi:hypothetical protein